MTDRELQIVTELYKIRFTEDERRLLLEGGRHALDKQRAHVLRAALQKCECPACHGFICQRSADRNYQVGTSVPDDSYECPICRTRLTWHLGITGEQWFTLTNPIVQEAKR